MGVSAAVFASAGKRTEHYVPGVYSRSYNVTSPSGVSAGNLCIMGKSTGGDPYTLLEFGSIAEAKETLISGELLDAVAFAFSGSSEYVPQKVYAMRVNGGKQASLTLKNGSTNLITLLSWDYGSHTNQIKLKVENGTLAGSKRITAVYKSESKEINNIIKKSIQIVGTGTSPTVTVDSEGIKLKTSIDIEGTPTQVTENYKFEDYPTVSDMVARINDSKYFTSVLLDPNTNSLSSELDTATTVDASEATVLTSNLAAFVEALESIPFISKVNLITTTTRVVPENMNFTYFTEGSSGTYTIEDWTTALTALEAEDVQIVTTPCTDTDVQTLIANHCSTMSSTVNRKERTCIFGGVLDESDDDAITKATAFNNRLVSYVVDSVIAVNPITGSSEDVNGAMLACMLAGMESAMDVHIPLTNKTLNVLGFRKNRSITNLEKLIKGGVITCNPNPDDNTNFVVIRAVTTYQQDDLISNERSMTREELYMNRDLRKTFAPIIGTPNNTGTSALIQTLKTKGDEWATAGYVVRNNSNEAVWNTSVKINGDKIIVKYSRYLTAPTNFVFITTTNHVYTSEIEL